MIKVKEALFYLADYLNYNRPDFQPEISAETFRRAKQNDPGVAREMLYLIVSVLGRVNNFQTKPNTSLEDNRKLLNLYLSLNEHPFTINVLGRESVDLRSSRELLKILFWMLFGAPGILYKLDEEFVANIKKPKYPPELFQKDSNHDPSSISREKHYEKSVKKLDAVDSMSDTLHLKNLLNLKLDLVKSLYTSHQKHLQLLTASMPNLNRQKLSLNVLTMLSKPSLVESFIRLQNQKKELFEEMNQKIAQRKAILEWFGSLEASTSSISPQNRMMYQEIGDLEEAEILAADCGYFGKELVEFQEVYNKLTKSLEHLHKAAPLVKKFGQFWQETSQNLSQSPEYRKMIGETVTRETTRLENKYNRNKAKHQAFYTPTEEDLEERPKKIDVFKVLVDMQIGQKTRQREKEGEKVKVEVGRGEKVCKETVDGLKQEFREFVSEVTDFLQEYSIRVINRQ